MKFSKNIMGIVTTLILVVLLTQSRFFDFLTETPLGRVILLAFIILISCTNKILGLLAVLLIIIAFNQYAPWDNVVQSYNYYEGFDVSGNAHAATVVNDKATMLKFKENVMKKKLQDVNNKISDASQKATTTSSSSSSSSTETFGGREGFCMTDRESTMLRGKQSNSIPVFNNSREQDDDISPSDKSVFSTSFSSF
jgi:hypothetical protein